MPITWRRAVLNDVGPCLSLQPLNRGDALPDVNSAIRPWQSVLSDPFFLSVVIEANPAIDTHHLVGFGAAVLVCPQFAASEAAAPRAYIASRILASIDEGRSVLATREMVAKANARQGIEVMVLYNACRGHILGPEERHGVRMAFVDSLVQQLSGFRVSRIFAETTNEFMEALHRESPEYRVVAEQPDIGHVIHLMTRESATASPGSVGNLIFASRKPVLKLRESDQELLLAALGGATDHELALQLRTTLSAIKARWRSTFARIADVMPDLIGENFRQEIRGNQKRHRVLAYVRSHMEELRPYNCAERSMK